MFKINFSKRLWLLVLLGSALGLAVPGLAWAGEFLSKLSEIVGYIIWLIWIGPQLVLLQLELWLLPVVAAYNNFTNVGGVVTGWNIMRDVANMFFILILLIIAFATIIGVERYGYRALLRKLIIMSILVNFSMTIVGLLIDLSQVVMLTFVAAIKDVASGNIVVGFGLVDAFNLRLDEGSVQDFGNYITTLILGAIMITVVVAVIGIFILILAIRIVKLWIIVVMAPLAFLFYVYPGTQKYYSEWQSELISNLIIGPVLAFFLWLSFTIIGRGDIYGGFIKESDDPQGGVTTNLSQVTSKSNITNFIIAVAMLIGGLQYAAKTGSGAAAALAGKGVTSIRAGLQRRATRLGTTAARPALRAGGELTAGAGGRLAKVPLLGRLAGRRMQTAGMAWQARARGITRVFSEEEEKKTKDMTPIQRKEFYAARSRQLMGGDARNLKIRQQIDEGYYKDADASAVLADGTPDQVRRRKYREMEEDYSHIKSKGAPADDKYVSRMRFMNSALLGAGEEEEVRDSVREKGAKTAFEDMHFQVSEKKDASGRVIGQEIAGGTQAALKVFLEQDAKVRKAILEGKDKKELEQFSKALQLLGHDESKMFDGAGKVQKDSTDYRKLETLGQIDTKALAPLYHQLGQGLSEEDKAARQKAFLKEASPRVEGKEMAKLDVADTAQKDLFVGLSKQVSTGQRAELLSATGGKKDPRVQAMVEAQVQEGDIKINLDNPTTRNFVTPEQIKAYFDNEISDAPDKNKARTTLAEQNLDYAHLVYEGDDAGLVEFAKNLKKEELLKIKTEVLKEKIIPQLEPAMQEALSKEGLGEGDPKTKSDVKKRRGKVGFQPDSETLGTTTGGKGRGDSRTT